MNTTTKTQPGARAKLIAKIESQTTRQLLAHHAHLAAMPTEQKADEHRMVSAMIADVIETRLNLTDAMDAIIDADDYSGTYHDLMLAAIVATGQDEAL